MSPALFGKFSGGGTGRGKLAGRSANRRATLPAGVGLGHAPNLGRARDACGG
ncbi:hypothetical protein [Deinococcus aetherius]|uniref:hypothetical protein n=1 Tax=Deinococcus aetherius TaxID=200252 RepID=UPI00222F0857|nr:hypothetical protein [Deinococcus aetherius]